MTTADISFSSTFVTCHGPITSLDRDGVGLPGIQMRFSDSALRQSLERWMQAQDSREQPAVGPAWIYATASWNVENGYWLLQHWMPGARTPQAREHLDNMSAIAAAATSAGAADQLTKNGSETDALQSSRVPGLEPPAPTPTPAVANGVKKGFAFTPMQPAVRRAPVKPVESTFLKNERRTPPLAASPERTKPTAVAAATRASSDTAASGPSRAPVSQKGMPTAEVTANSRVVPPTEGSRQPMRAAQPTGARRGGFGTAGPQASDAAQAPPTAGAIGARRGTLATEKARSDFIAKSGVPELDITDIPF